VLVKNCKRKMFASSGCSFVVFLFIKGLVLIVSLNRSIEVKTVPAHLRR